MRIAHVVSTFPPYHGGMGNAAKEIAERTVARGHEVAVVTPKRVESGEWRVESDRKSETTNYQLSTINSALRFGNAAWCPSIAHTLEKLQPDIIHLHWPFIGGITPVLQWRQGAPPRRLIVHYHMDLIADGWKGKLFMAYQRLAFPRMLRIADRAVVSSLDYARNGALAPHVDQLGDRLVEIPFGIDVARFRPVYDQRPGVDHRIPDSRFQILFVGGLDRAHTFKGVEVLLNAIVQVSDVRLRIVGDGDLRSAYEARTCALGISDRVEFLGTVSDADLPSVYQSANVLVLPSTARSEAFGIVLLEAMASGLPVIASDLPGVRTVVADGETGFFVPPGDAETLAERLAALVRNPERVRQMGTAARRRVEERYTWDRVMDAWGQCYATV